MINATIRKFGYPETLVADFDHWVVLVRPQAVTLGSLVVAAKGEAIALGALGPAAFTSLGKVVQRLEAALTSFVGYEKVNYLMLMMVDPHVHYHVFPRYAGVRSFDGETFADAGWPGMPDLGSARQLSAGTIAGMVDALHRHELVGNRAEADTLHPDQFR